MNDLEEVASPTEDLPTRRRGAAGWWVLGAVVVLVIAMIAGLLGVLLGRAAERRADRMVDRSAPIDAPRLPQQTPGDTRPEPGSIAALAAQSLPSVVSVSVDAGNDSSSGSGFIVATEGYIVTNNHVIAAAALNPAASRIEVVLFDGRRAEASILGRNESYDLAVLAVDPQDVGGELTAMTWADDERVRTGDSVIAIGAPLGLDGTVTQGIVSALNRPVTTGQRGGNTSYIDAIQTDAAINPGNSGGPLVDGDGRVIGVNSAIATLAFGTAAGSIGLGFAIPSSDAERIAAEIIATGESSTPIIGVTLDPLFPGPGALVEEVTPGGPAQQAGLRRGDVITAVDGRPVADAQTLIIAIRANAPGDRITLRVVRGTEQFTAEVTLQARSDVP